MRIFLSYASEQKQPAETIAFSLRSRGHKVFLDKDDLPPGKSYDDQIQTAVASADLFIFLISPESVAKGRYTLTELEYARHRWRTPDRFVLPVMMRTTDMASVPTYLKAVTIHEPAGNLAAEVAFWVDKLRGANYVKQVVGWFFLAGFLSGLAYAGSKEGWIFSPEIPLTTAISRITYHFVGVFEAVLLLPAGPLFGVAVWRLASTTRWRASGGAIVIGFTALLGIMAGNYVYGSNISNWKKIDDARTEFRRQQVQPDSGATGSENASIPATPLDRALSLEWTTLRAQIGAAYGAIVALGFAAAGLISGLAMANIRRWFTTVAVGVLLGGTLYAATDSLQVSFLLFYMGMFTLMGYWIARGQV